MTGASSDHAGLDAHGDDLAGHAGLPRDADEVVAGGGGGDALTGAVGRDLVACGDGAAEGHAGEAAVLAGDGPALGGTLVDHEQGRGGPGGDGGEAAAV